MSRYKYQARTSSGLLERGVIESDSSANLVGQLSEKGLTPISITELSQPTQKKPLILKGKRIKSSDLSAICWQLTTMVEGGVPLTEAINTISEDAPNLRLQKILEQIHEKLLKGETFSESLLAFPSVFNSLSRAIIIAGETSGNLAGSFHKLAEYFDNRDKLAKQIKGAMAYPVFVLVFIVLIIVFIMAFIIPRFRSIFDTIGSKLPAFTRGFMACYDMICHNILYIIGLFVAMIVLAVLAYTKTKKGHYFSSKLVLGLPLFGQILKQAFIITFCRTMETLISAGVSVLDIFLILSEMSENDIIKNAVVEAREHVVGGSSISLSMNVTGFFPKMVIKMVEVGEKSGAMANVLNRTGDYYERKVNAMITTLMGLLEPFMIVSVGGIVLTVVLALYLPIFTMSDIN
ncbi:MAG: type II secretion system F family protein [Planctomycetota bacterium]